MPPLSNKAFGSNRVTAQTEQKERKLTGQCTIARKNGDSGKPQRDTVQNRSLASAPTLWSRQMCRSGIA